MKNEFRNYFLSKPIKDGNAYKQIIMHECMWDANKWGNKLSGKSLLTDLEKEKIVEIEKMVRICAQLGWKLSQYHDRMKAGVKLLKHEIEVIDQFANFGVNDVFTTGSEATIGSHRQVVEI